MNFNALFSLAKKLGAAFIFALIILGLTIKGADIFYGHTDPGKTRGYSIDVANTPAASATSAAAAASTSSESDKPVDIAPYLAKADLKSGEQLIKRCQVCHGFEKGKPNGVGPNQYGLVGRKVASVDGFSYSDAMKAKGGNWDFQPLSEFLTNPQKVVPGTKMGFAGLKKPEERAAVIAYINKNFSDKPLDIPTK